MKASSGTEQISIWGQGTILNSRRYLNEALPTFLMKIIIAIPAYNEEKTLPNVLKEIKQIMDKKEYEYQILVTNDGSKDKTAEVAKKEGALVVSHKRNMGLAETFRTEMKECLKLDVDVIIHTDADGQYPAKYLPHLIDKIGQGNDLVLGSRFGGGKYSGTIMKRIGNISFAKVFSSLIKTKITDTTTGFRAFTKEVAELPMINSFTYTQEQLIRVGRTKMRIAEIPITTEKTRKSRLFKNSFSYALKAWINILRIYRDYSPLSFFGKAGLFFIFLSFIVGLILLSQNYQLGFVSGFWDQHIPSLILIVILFSGGLQLIFFGLLADMRKN